MQAGAPEWIAADEVLFRMQRHRAGPGTTIETHAHPATVVYMIESGGVESSTSGPRGELTDTWRAGSQFGTLAVEGLEHTLSVVDDEATSFRESVATPRSSTAQ